MFLSGDDSLNIFLQVKYSSNCSHVEPIPVELINFLGNWVR